MAFDLSQVPIQLSQFIVLLIFTPLGIAVTVLRFVAIRRGVRKTSVEDWLAVVATLFFILTNLAGLIAINILNGRQIEVEISESPSDYRHMREWDMSGLYFYFVQVWAIKLSVLALYRRIFGIEKAYRVWIYVLASIQTLLSVVFCIFQALQCRPFERFFDLSIPGTCTSEGTAIASFEIPNSLIDFAMMILAMWMIRPRQLSSVIKWRLRFLFGLGGFVGVVGFIKVGVTYSTSDLYAFSAVSLWTCVQMFVALLCSGLPVFHTLLPTAAFWSKLSPRLASYYANLKQGMRNTTGRSSTKRSRRDSTCKQPSWIHLDERSTKGLAWPETTYSVESRALKESATQDMHREYPDI